TCALPISGFVLNSAQFRTHVLPAKAQGMAIERQAETSVEHGVDEFAIIDKLARLRPVLLHALLAIQRHTRFPEAPAPSVGQAVRGAPVLLLVPVQIRGNRLTRC